MARKKLKAEGFTLIELMIVVAIIGILAAIAIPRFADLLEKSREGATKGNVGSINSALSIYYGDHEGVWPEVLTTADSTLEFSKYMDSIPKVKVTGKFAGIVASSSLNPSNYQGESVLHVAYGSFPGSSGRGWMYDSLGGKVYVNSIVKDSKNVPYSVYGHE